MMLQKMTVSHSRTTEFDFLKGLLIILVISFHLVYIGDSYPYAKRVVYTFHMPAFLLMSGYLMNISKPWRRFARTMLGYAVPYLVMEGAYVVMASLLPVGEHVDELTVSVFLDKLLLHPLGPYWYLQTLILCGGAYAAVFRLVPMKTVSRLILLVAVFQLLAVLGLMSFGCAVYFLLGAAIRQSGVRFGDVFRHSAVAVLPFALLAAQPRHLQMDTTGGMLMVFLVMSWTFFVYRHIGKGLRRLLTFLGRHTMPLFLFSPVFTFPCRLLQPFLAFDSSGLAFWLASLIICIAGSLAIDWLMSQTGASRYFYVRTQNRRGLHIAQPAQDVVEVGHDHEQDDDAEADVLGADHELLRRFAARDHLIDEEQDVAAVEGRDGQDVHEGQDDRQEGRHLPETVPVPR